MSGVNSPAKGYAVRGYTVWCGECGNWDQVSGSLKSCEKLWKKNGWTKTRRWGWLCPECSDGVAQERSMELE